MHQAWFILSGALLGAFAVKVGNIYISRIEMILGVQVDHLDVNEIEAVAQLHFPGYGLLGLILGNVWFLASFASSPWHAMAAIVLTTLLWLLAYIDARTAILPDALTGALFMSGFVWHVVTQPDHLPQYAYCLAALLGYGIPMMMNIPCRLRQGIDAIGQGDAKLLAGLGIWLGPVSLCVSIVHASCALLVYTCVRYLVRAKTSNAVPLGPFLALASNIWILKNV